MSKKNKIIVHEEEPTSKAAKIADTIPEKDIFLLNEEFQLLDPDHHHHFNRPSNETVNLSHSIAERLKQHGYIDHFLDHVLGLMIVKSSGTSNVAGIMVVGAVGVPDLHLCQAHQVHGDKPLYKMSFARSNLMNFFKSKPGFIPERFLETGFFEHAGYAIAACSTLSISRCYEYFKSLGHLDSAIINELFPDDGSVIIPQPKSLAEENQRRTLLMNSIEFIKTFNNKTYEITTKDGRHLNVKVRLEVEEIEVGDLEIFEKLLCYRVLESSIKGNNN